MAQVRTNQMSGTSGELDPKLVDRSDVKHYYSGYERMRNVILRPQGTWTRRPGLVYDATIVRQITRVSTGITPTAANGGTAGNANDNDTTTDVLTTTNLSTTTNYVVIHFDLGSAKTILFADVRKLSITAGTSLNEFQIQYSTDNAAWTIVGTAFDVVDPTPIYRRRRANVSARYWRVVRVGTTDLTTDKATLGGFDLWEQSATKSVKRSIPFAFSTTQRYLLIATDRNISVFKAGVLQADIYIPHTSAQLAAMNWTQSLDTLNLFHEDVQTHEVQRSGAHDEWNDVPVTYSNIPQYDFGAGAENVWSATRGWPRCGAYHDGRFWLAGSASRPSTLWASNITNGVYDFDVGSGAADEAIDVTIDFDEVPSIFNIVVGRHLSLFTSAGEFYLLPNTEAITPENIDVKSSTTVGSYRAGLRTVRVEGAILFIQHGGGSIREFLYTDTEQAYSSNNITLLASHLINSPADFALRSALSTEEPDFVFVVNGDGTVATLCTLRSQEITGWVLHETDGNVVAVGIDDDVIYFCVERTINGAEVTFLEHYDSAALLDASKITTSGLPQDDFTVAHLEGETAKARADGSNLVDVAVGTGGAVTISRNAETSCEIGIAWPDVKENEVDRLQDNRGLTEAKARGVVYKDETAAAESAILWVRTMPAEAAIQGVAMAGLMKRVTEIAIQFIETRNCWFRANDTDHEEISFRALGSGLLDAPPPLYTGMRVERGMLGYTRDGQVEITQRNPGEIEVAGIVKEIKI